MIVFYYIRIKYFKIKNMINKLFVVTLFVLTLNLSLVKATDFDEKEIVVEMKINPDILKDVNKCTKVDFKLSPSLTQVEVKEWMENGKNHYNVESFNILKGNEKDGWEFEIIFKNGLDYATGKELFSGTLLIDYVVLNGNKIATNLFVSKNLSFR